MRVSSFFVDGEAAATWVPRLSYVVWDADHSHKRLPDFTVLSRIQAGSYDASGYTRTLM